MRMEPSQQGSFLQLERKQQLHQLKKDEIWVLKTCCNVSLRSCFFTVKSMASCVTQNFTPKMVKSSSLLITCDTVFRNTFPNLYHFGISWYSWLLTILFCVQNSLLWLILSEKVIFSHWDWNIVMACTPPPGYSSIKIWLCASIYACKIFQVTCLAYSGKLYPIMDR